MNLNQTTPHATTPGPQPGFLLLYALIPFLLLALLVCIAVVVSSHEFIILLIIMVAISLRFFPA